MMPVRRCHDPVAVVGVDARRDPGDVAFRGRPIALQRGVIRLVAQMRPAVLAPFEPHRIRLAADPALRRVFVVVAGAVEHHQRAIVLDMRAVAMADGLQRQMRAAIGEHRVARVHLVRPERRRGPGDVLHMPGFGAALRPHQVVHAAAFVQVRALRVGSGDAAADMYPLGEHTPTVRVDCGQVDAGLLLPGAAFVAADVRGAVVVEEQAGVDARPAVHPDRVGPAGVRVAGGQDHVAAVHVGDDQIVRAVVPAQRGRVDALAVAHRVVGELFRAVHRIADQAPVFAVLTLPDRQPGEELERAVDHQVPALGLLADRGIREESGGDAPRLRDVEQGHSACSLRAVYGSGIVDRTAADHRTIGPRRSCQFSPSSRARAAAKTSATSGS